MSAPKISVLMPVYNGAPYLAAAIVSILEQTEPDFELLIVDDGSTDQTAQIVKTFSDPRIKYFSQTHQGLVPTLNFALDQAQGEYLARLDADDIATNDRLAKQVAFLNQNNLVAGGTWAEIIDTQGKKIGEVNYPPREAKKIKWFSLWHNPFIHSSMILRRSIVKKVGGYRNFKHVEDYELWSRIIFRFPTGNLPEQLLKYRLHPQQTTVSQNKIMRWNGFFIRLLVIKRAIKSLF